MKAWLEQCAASGGGDAPEAVADAAKIVVATVLVNRLDKIVKL